MSEPAFGNLEADDLSSALRRPGQAAPGEPPLSTPAPSLEAIAPRELFVRHARKDGRSVAVLRAIDYGASCVVETEAHPANSPTALRPGPYTFADARQATAFVTEAVEALMYLGCDISAE